MSPGNEIVSGTLLSATDLPQEPQKERMEIYQRDPEEASVCNNSVTDMGTDDGYYLEGVEEKYQALEAVPAARCTEDKALLEESGGGLSVRKRGRRRRAEGESNWLETSATPEQRPPTTQPSCSSKRSYRGVNCTTPDTRTSVTAASSPPSTRLRVHQNVRLRTDSPSPRHPISHGGEDSNRLVAMKRLPHRSSRPQPQKKHKDDFLGSWPSRKQSASMGSWTVA